MGRREGRKGGSLKRRVRSPVARGDMKNCTSLWREAHFQVQMYKTHQARTTFGSWDVEKLHGAVARSTFANQIVQNTPASDHFLKFRCGKMARRCSENRICKSKCRKHTMFGALFEVRVSKICTPLARSTFASPNVENMKGSDNLWRDGGRRTLRQWRKAHLQVKNTKHQRFGIFLEVRMSKKCPTDEIDRLIVS